MLENMDFLLLYIHNWISCKLKILVHLHSRFCFLNISWKKSAIANYIMKNIIEDKTMKMMVYNVEDII